MAHAWGEKVHSYKRSMLYDNEYGILLLPQRSEFHEKDALKPEWADTCLC